MKMNEPTPEPVISQNISVSCQEQYCCIKNESCDSILDTPSHIKKDSFGSREQDDIQSKQQDIPVNNLSHQNSNNQERKQSHDSNIAERDSRDTLFSQDLQQYKKKIKTCMSIGNAEVIRDISPPTRLSVSKREINIDASHKEQMNRVASGQSPHNYEKQTDYQICNEDLTKCTSLSSKFPSSIQSSEKQSIDDNSRSECNTTLVDLLLDNNLETSSREISGFRDIEMGKKTPDEERIVSLSRSVQDLIASDCIKDDEFEMSNDRRKSKRIRDSEVKTNIGNRTDNKIRNTSKKIKLRTPASKKEDSQSLNFDDDDDLPDLNISPLNKEISKPTLAVNILIWALHRNLWWPSYIKHIYQRNKKVSVHFIGCDQTVGIKISWKNIRSFEQGNIPSFVNQSSKGLLDAVQLCNTYIKLCECRQDFLPHQFFCLPVYEQDALMKQEDCTRLDSDVTTISKKGNEGEETPKSDKKYLKEKTKGNKSEDKMLSMSARDRRKLEMAIQTRRRENEKLLKYIRSEECISHLWQIFTGEKASKRHEMYQDECSRKMLLWSGVGPFHLDEEDEQILEVIDFLHTELCSKQKDFLQAHDYAIRVWMPEAIKEALRVVKKVPETELENALDTGYKETLIEKKARRLDFTFM